MTKHREQILEHKQSRGVILRLWREWVSVYRSRIALALGLMVIVAATSSAYPALISEVLTVFKTTSMTACISCRLRLFCYQLSALYPCICRS